MRRAAPIGGLLASLAVLTALASCGQKGALTMPAAASPPAVASSASAVTK